jgi:ribonucleoside-diphosphate reductase alpha chain
VAHEGRSNNPLQVAPHTSIGSALAGRADTAGLTEADGGNGAPKAGNGGMSQPAASAMTETRPLQPAKIRGLDLGPACSQCGSMMQRTGSCYTCPSCGNNTGCG